MSDNSKKIQDSFKAVYTPVAKAIGECLIQIPDKDLDATSAIAAIIAVAIDISAKANKIAQEANISKLLVNSDHLAKFTALTLVNTLVFSDDVRIALDAVVAAGSKPPVAESSKLN